MFKKKIRRILTKGTEKLLCLKGFLLKTIKYFQKILTLLIKIINRYKNHLNLVIKINFFFRNYKLLYFS